MTSHFLWASRTTPLQNRGRNFVRSKRRPHYMSRAQLLIFCVLTIWKHLLNLSGRGPSICYRRPFCRLKAPLGLSLLRGASQTRAMRFERSGRGQEPSRGHKFSILENVVLHRDFTSATLASFDVILLGRTCPKPCSYSHLAVRKNGVSCLHSSTEELAKRQEVQ